nr:tyrosine-type recombinase/integrase [Desnuesiella massiliensis]
MNKEDPLFISEKNTRLTSRSTYRIVVKYTKMARLEDVSPYALRHRFCKNLVDKGVRLERIAYLAEHENLEMTRRYS